MRVEEYGAPKGKRGSKPKALPAAEMAAAYQAGATYQQVAERYGVSLWTVRNYLLAAGVTPKGKRGSKPKALPVAEMAAAYQAGATYQQVAERYGVSLWTVRNYLLAAGVTPHPRPRDTARRQAIYDAYQSGRTLTQLGEEHGITRERIRQLIARYERDHGLVKKRNIYGAEFEWRECAECGEIFSARPTAPNLYCSRRCGARKSALDLPIAAMLADYQAGMTYAEVGAKYGVARITVYRHLRRAGVPLQRPKARR